MSGARTQPKSTFRWQAILIVLPVLVLAAVGLTSLRQDKNLAEHDARERARVIANDLAPKILSLLTSDLPDQPGYSFQINDAGGLVFPPPFDPVPTPGPFDLKDLDARQLRLWQKLQSADLGAADPAPLVEAARELIDANPPERFAAAARYDLGLLYLRQGKLLEAMETFGLVAEKYPGVNSESGLPFRAMAQFKFCQVWPNLTTNAILGTAAIHITPGQASRNGAVPELAPLQMEHVVPLETFCSNVVYQPTALTPYLLARIHERARAAKLEVLPAHKAATNSGAQIVYQQIDGTASGQEWGTPVAQAQIQKWEDIWETHETSRQLFSAVRPYVMGESLARLLVDGNQFGPTKLNVSEIASNRLASSPRLFWIETPEPVSHRVPGSAAPIAQRRWLIVRFDRSATGQKYRCLSEAMVASQVGSLVRGTKLIPEYFGFSVELAGSKLAGPGLDLGMWHYVQMVGSKGPGGMAKYGTGEVASAPLATAESEGDRGLLRVGVYLTSPTTFYQIQRMRAAWFGAVIVISIVAALVGLAAAWRAFTRQQQLNEMKSNFVSSVSHELRAPIASVRLMAESLERGKIQEPQKQGEYFRFIVQECRRLSALIENVLDFSRIEQGRKQYEFEPTDLAAMTRETVRLLEPYATERQVQLKIELIEEQEETSNIEHRTPNIECPPSNGVGRMFELSVDGRALQQALVNLIDNAVKHSPKGETVTVGLEVSGATCQVSGEGGDASRSLADTSQLTPGTSSPDTLQLYVEDHGPGIPADEHEKIFERFYRLGSELRRETQGVGIGLSIVKHIVDAHGGRVVVRSAVGEGSRFTIELPRKNSEIRIPKSE